MRTMQASIIHALQNIVGTRHTCNYTCITKYHTTHEHIALKGEVPGSMGSRTKEQQEIEYGGDNPHHIRFRASAEQVNKISIHENYRLSKLCENCIIVRFN